ncbi:uncharacterized protein LOC123304824 [Chrysoperla carnea]|uniref:uncharacterized protein LOC123304824 n=2 Tax=Chrysoperla carnea TaxID=189513 RepID=UPI001D087C06|nr:uncharacterized protein LOC123304824 [Chrysoperla carnea]
MAKSYAVVFFIGQDSYSEIPSNWLLYNDEPEGKRTKCQWPPSFAKNLQQLLKQRVEPSQDWPIHEIEILRYCDTLAKARKAAEDSEYESTTDKPLGRGLRSKRLTAVAAAAATFNSKNNKVSDSSEEDSDDKTTKKVSPMPTMHKIPAIQNQIKPPLVANISSSVRKMNETDGAQSVIQKHFEDDSRTTGSGCTRNNENYVPSDLENDDDDDDNRFNVLNAKLNKCLRLLGALTVDVKDVKQRTAINNCGNACDVGSETALQIKKDLPLKSRAEVIAFEEKLSNSQDYRQQFVSS